MMIWMIDFRAIDAALDLAAHVLKHGLKLPERYNRTAGCLVAEEIATVALAERDKVTLEQLQRGGALTEEQDMPDQARAKRFKALGRPRAGSAAALPPQADQRLGGGNARPLQSARTTLGAA